MAPPTILRPSCAPATRGAPPAQYSEECGMSNEADTCREYVVPALLAAGWDAEPRAIVEQYIFTDGRVVVVGRNANRNEGKRADYLLRYRPDLALAVVEAKAEYKLPEDGLQQAMDYAAILDLKFAY